MPKSSTNRHEIRRRVHPSRLANGERRWPILLERLDPEHWVNQDLDESFRRARSTSRPQGGNKRSGSPGHFAQYEPQFTAEQFHARIAPDNATTLSGIEWLWRLKRA